MRLDCELWKEFKYCIRALTPCTAAAAAVTALQPEDYWSPAIDVPPGYGYQDDYGPISPMPNHDGTGEGGRGVLVVHSAFAPAQHSTAQHSTARHPATCQTCHSTTAHTMQCTVDHELVSGPPPPFSPPNAPPPPLCLPPPLPACLPSPPPLSTQSASSGMTPCGATLTTSR
jgi:hypothetical protein